MSMFSGPVSIDDALLYFVLYVSGCSRNVPWGKEAFDCFIVNRRNSLKPKSVEQIGLEFASSNTDWIETFGPMAERLHDAIDQASVQVGRQAKIGDGSPMTAWHDDLIDDTAIAGYIKTGGHGYQSVKLVVVVGDRGVCVWKVGG